MISEVFTVHRSLVSAAGMLSVALCLRLHAIACIIWHAHLLKVVYSISLCTTIRHSSNDDIDWKDGGRVLQLNRSIKYKIFRNRKYRTTCLYYL